MNSFLGPPDALGSLLVHRAHHALLYALAHSNPSDPLALQSALARALRMLACATADVAWPGRWGLRPELHACKLEARAALDYFFEVCAPFSVSRKPLTKLTLALSASRP